jgi:hypothetical protein
LILLLAAFAGSIVREPMHQRRKHQEDFEIIKADKQSHNNRLINTSHRLNLIHTEYAPMKSLRQQEDLMDTIKRSLRMDGALEKSINERTQ